MLARILALAADVTDGRLERMEVRMEGLTRRTVPRDVVVAWAQDGHSILPAPDGRPGPSIHRVQVEGKTYLREDTSLVAEDHLPSLPRLVG